MVQIVVEVKVIVHQQRADQKAGGGPHVVAEAAHRSGTGPLCLWEPQRAQQRGRGLVGEYITAWVTVTARSQSQSQHIDLPDRTTVRLTAAAWSRERGGEEEEGRGGWGGHSNRLGSVREHDGEHGADPRS